MNFEINLRFFPKFESKGCWILKEFVFTNTNTPAHKPRQGVLQDDVQIFLYDLGDMNRPSHQIEEVIKFQKELTDKEIWEKVSRKLMMFTSILTIETNTSYD
jgi:hypothetical protein